MKRITVVAAVVLVTIVLPCRAALAHPLGNFTVNRYSGVRITPDHVFVHYVVDAAEIPTYQQRDLIDIDGDGHLSPRETAAFAAGECSQIGRHLVATVARSRLSFGLVRSNLTFVPGAAGLPTARITCEFSASSSRSATLTYRDANQSDRVGWREITVVGDGTTLTTSSVPTTSISDELRSYPQDLLASPLDVRTASTTFKAGGPAFHPPAADGAPGLLPRGVDQVTRAFTSFLAHRHVTMPFAVVAVLFALALGAIHALAPGHGKTVMAAYLVGQKGSVAQGTLIGLTVTATHTLGVLLLGIVVSTSATIAPERIYPVLGVASGVMLGAIGIAFLRRALHRRHHDHEHAPVVVGRGGLIGMGFAGGLVPSPSALVVLLGAIALNRFWFGVGLVVAYGVGMALTLCGAGLLLVKVRVRFEKRARPSTTRLARLSRAVPVLTATMITGAGVILAVRGIVQI